MAIGKIEIKNKKIFVAMSGGVDSSVAAALLKKQGYDITGVFVKGWYPEGMVCGWKDERRDALRAAAKLSIPFLTYDFSKEYENKIIGYLKKEYAAGRTPNPDVMCNKYIKFGLFLEKSLKLGADLIATGHYVRRSPACQTKAKPLFNKGLAFVKLFQAKDKNKDQSYFLWTLTQGQLKYCLFPIGNYKKPDVRKLAKKFGLATAEKKDSQGLCFVGDINFSLFLRSILAKKEGNVKTARGKIIGKHDGVQFYTIGQRHGLKIPGKKPYYVAEKDLKNNVLMVAEQKDEKKFYKKNVAIKNVNWIVGKAPDIKKIYKARIRYRQPLQSCKLHVTRYGLLVTFSKPQRAVTPGQSLVLYRKPSFAKASEGDFVEMLGGGIIV